MLMIKYTLKIPDNQYYKNIFYFMYTYAHVKNNQKYQKSHGNSKISHAKSAFFLHKVNPGHAPG